MILYLRGAWPVFRSRPLFVFALFHLPLLPIKLLIVLNILGTADIFRGIMVSLYGKGEGKWSCPGLRS